MRDGPRIFELAPVVAGERRPRVHIGTFDRPVGMQRCISQGHIVLRADPAIEYLRAFMTDPDRGQPTYIGQVRRGVRKLVRE